MANVVVYVEQRLGKLRSVAYEAVSAGRRLADSLGGGQVVAVALGKDRLPELADLGAYGADKVVAGAHDLFAQYSAEAYALALGKVARAADAHYVLAPASAEGKDFIPRVAIKLDAGYMADVTAISVENGTVHITRPIYAGKAFNVMHSADTPQVATLRPKLFAAVKSREGAQAPIEDLGAIDAGGIKAVFKEFKMTGGGQLDVTEANIIVTGGRGLGKGENFSVLEPLAAVLKAAIGASRAAVDAGWIEHSHQVGQTGKVVTPSLYIACGISGAIQHLAGMSNSKVIVAINNNADAPIFQVADYGIVGDLFEVVPALTAELKKFMD